MLCVADGGSDVLLTTADALLASVTTNPTVVGVGIGAGAVSIAAGEATGGSGGDTIAFDFNMGTGAVGQSLTSITVTAGSGYSVGDVITVQATLTAKFNAIAPGASASSIWLSLNRWWFSKLQAEGYRPC